MGGGGIKPEQKQDGGLVMMRKQLHVKMEMVKFMFESQGGCYSYIKKQVAQNQRAAAI